jgi:hypothetical protein
MRSTKRTLLVSGGLAAGGAVLTLFGIWMFEREGETLASGLPIFVGLAIGPAALVYFISSAVSGLRKEQLESGVGEIARWRVSAAEWAAFREQEKRFIAAGRPYNVLNLREGSPRDGDVVFAKKAVIADEDYHDLIPGGLDDLQSIEWVQGAPSCFEFHFKTRRSAGASGTGGFSFTHTFLRVPVAAGEGREATKVFAHYTRITRRGVAIAMRNPKLTISICLGIAAVCALAAAWGFANREAAHLAEAPLVAAVTGVILGIGALLLAGIVAYRVHVLKS